MKNQLCRAGMMIVLALMASGCGKKASQPAEKPENVQTENVQTENIAVKTPEMPDVSGVVLEKPVFDKKKAARPVRLSQAALIGLEPEALEKAVIRSFNHAISDDGEDVKKVRQAADLGNEEACEKLALYYLAFPSTDPRYELGRQYLLKVENYKSSEALLTRALFEYDNRIDNADKAKPYFVRAMAESDESVLQWLLDHEDIGLFEPAWEKLHQLYEAKSTAMDAEAMFRLAELYNVYPSKRDSEKFESLLMQSAKQSYGPACYMYALMLMNRNKAQEGLDMLKRAVDLNVDEANSMLSFLYLVAMLKDSSEGASEYAGSHISPELYQILKAEISSNKETGKESIGDLFKIAELAKNSHGMEQGCKVLFALAGSGDWAQRIKDDAIDCLKQYVDKNESRIACDSIDSMFPFDSEEIYESVFNLEQRKKISTLMINCYENMMGSGLDYVTKGQNVLSSATKIGLLYSGDVDDTIVPDETLANQYLTYSAVKNEDIVAQMSLASAYMNGEFFGKQSTQRGCYWAMKASEQTVCKDLCKTVKIEEGEALVLDENMNENDAEMAMMVCTVCQFARTMMTECSL